MNPDMKEIDRERGFYESTRPENVQKFIKNGIVDQAMALARSGIIPGVSFVTVEAENLKTDEDIAKVISSVKVDDPEFQKIDIKNPEGFVKAATLTTAMIEVTNKEIDNPKVKSILQDAQDRVIEGAIDVAQKTLPRRTFLKLLTSITGAALVVNACSPTIVGPVIPIDGDTPTPTLAVPTETATPESPLPAGPLRDLESRLGPACEITKSAEGDYYTINGYEAIKLFEDGSTEMLIDGEARVTGMQAIDKDTEGNIIWGLWGDEDKDGVWTMETYRAPTSAEETGNWRKLAILRGHEKEQQMADLLFYAESLADHTNEFNGITVTYNFKTYENYDVRPREWQIKNWSRNRQGEFILNPVPSNSEIPYDYAVGSTSNARPMLVALDNGWFNIEIYNVDGIPQLPAVHVPAVGMNSDRSLINLSALARQNELDRFAYLLTKNDRGQIYFGLHKDPLKYDYPEMITDLDLASFTVVVNQAYFNAVGAPELDKLQVVKSLPEELGQALLILKVRPEKQKP